MVTENKNFSGQRPPSVEDTIYVGCNFSQPQPRLAQGKYVGRRLFPGDNIPRTFVNCLMMNALPPAGSTVQGRKMTIVQPFVEDGTETVTVNGQTKTIKTYVRIIHGFTDPTTLQPVYFPQPRIIPVYPPRGTRAFRVKRKVKARDDALARAIGFDLEAETEADS